MIGRERPLTERQSSLFIEVAVLVYGNISTMTLLEHNYSFTRVKRIMHMYAYLLFTQLFPLELFKSQFRNLYIQMS